MLLRVSVFKWKLKYVVVGSIVLILLIKFFGVFVHLFEQDYFKEFSYPYDGDIRIFVEQLRENEEPEVFPMYFYNYTYLSKCDQKCVSEDNTIRLLFLIKSAPENFKRRSAIRQTWGYEQRFSDVNIRTVFILGVPPTKELQQQLEKENLKFKDIVQANFIDSYFNNTIKSMMGIKWAVKYCKVSKFNMFVDDDYYVSTKNLLSYVRNPTNYPRYLRSSKKEKGNRRFNIMEYEMPDDVRFYSGFVFFSSPHRHLSSKWYVSLEEYPFHLWPPYVTAGAYVLSHEALLDFYYASFYTKPFKFDDIYMGLLAKKMEIEPFHSDYFYFHKNSYSKESYRFTIASHGYSSPTELIQVWTEQKTLGNA